ncbi:hypothetical protein [Phytohabitans houttuyneae]|uniref:Uncharacterized protein n=1 Tax=Phytohabitans houttuyneae TaxID=1076126 RepID=A0A6V8JX41_9ACTN|nr:hypothetical protein [Phytohabitans houttuyneae]GFJ77262.1 hypothetical protein Phou_014420 [Phytohabitans houttuyneae]
MARLIRWTRSPDTPLPPITIAGHGQINHASLNDDLTRRLVAYVGTPPAVWGMLFVFDRRGRRFTLFSPDHEYTAMLAGGVAGGPLDVDISIHVSKFPVRLPGWRL